MSGFIKDKPRDCQYCYYHHLRGDLRRACPKYRRGYRHIQSDLDLHGLYGSALLYAV